MSTTAAAFDSWEKRWAYYWAYGGDVSTYAALSATEKLPGRTVGPSASFGWLTLTRSDPRASVVYPNSFRTETVRNALEPTTGEWVGYAIQSISRDGTGINAFEAVETSSGVWVIRNTDDIVFPAASAGTGVTLTHAVYMLGDYRLTPAPFYSTLVAELDTAIVIPSGGTGASTIPAGDLVFEFR